MDTPGHTSSASGSKYPKVAKKTIITSKVTSSPPRDTHSTSRVISTPPHSPTKSPLHHYQDDWWAIPQQRGSGSAAETKPLAVQAAMAQKTDPKTDYTYSRSGSYSKLHVDEGYISPNMSRRRLKGVGDSGSMMTSSVTSSSYSSSIRRPTPIIRLDESYLRSPENNNDHQQEVKTETAHTTHYQHGEEFSDHEFEEPSSRLLGVHGLRLPASATRSGKKYGKKWAPGSKEALRARRRSSRGRNSQMEDVTDTEEDEEETGSEYSVAVNDVASYRRFEKQLEYSGHESPIKETRLNHLYGLDNSDMEFSDTEQRKSVQVDRLHVPYDRHIVHRAPAGSILSTMYTFFYSILTTIITAISSFVRTCSQTVTSSMTTASTNVKQALLGYTWRALRWICYDVWIGNEKGQQSFVSAVSGSDRTSTTTTTTTTTTVTETIIEEEDDSADEIDSKPQFGIKTRRKGGPMKKFTGIASQRNDSWISRTLKTIIVTTTYIMLIPVAAAKGAVSGVASTANWLVGSNPKPTEQIQLGRTESAFEDTQYTTTVHEESSSSLLKHRRSRAMDKRQESETSGGTRDVQDESFVNRCMKTIVSTVTTILWLPANLFMGLGHAVSRGIYSVGHHASKLPGISQYHDEDKDTDTAVAYETRSSKVKFHSVSGKQKSKLTVMLARIRDALWWPIGLWLGKAIPGAAVGSANKLQRGLATSVVQDTWILSRTGHWRRAYGCCCCLIPLLFIPLLLTCAYYLYDRGLYKSPIVPVIVPEPIPVVPKDPSPPVVAGALYTDEDLAARVQTILIGLLKEREVHTHSVLSADWRAWANKFAEGQSAELNDHKKDVDARIAALVTERVEQLAVGMGTQSEEEAARQMAALAGQREKMTSLEGQLAAIIGLSDDLKEQLAKAKMDMHSQDEKVRQSGAAAVANLESKLDALSVELRNLQASHGALAAAFKDCCKNDSTLALLIRKGVEEHLAAMLGGSGGGGLPMGGPGGASETNFLRWLHSQFVGRDDMDSRLAALLAKIEDDIKATSSEAQNAATMAAAAAAAAAAKKAVDSSKTEQQTTVIGGVATGGVTEEHVKILIQNALMLYSADKTGKVDYALESAGGSVVSTRCSETYHRRTAQLSLFGIPLWYTSNSPRTVIQPDMQPGQCWAFRGDTGFLVIQLAGLVRPTAFTLEHIPKTLSPSGKIDSAPKEFSVLGLQHDRDMDGVFLGNYTYNAAGDPLQSFIVTESNSEAFPIVELRILSNHGNKEYTCLYRFRVHGVSTL